MSLRLNWSIGRSGGTPVLIILGRVAWFGSCAFAVIRAARKAPNNDLGRICSGSRFFDRRLPGLYAGAYHLARRSRRDPVASFGAVLSLAFSLGRAIPIALGAWAAGWLEKLGILSKYQKGFEIAGAVTLIASGPYMLNAYYFWIPSLAMRGPQ